MAAGNEIPNYDEGVQTANTKFRKPRERQLGGETQDPMSNTYLPLPLPAHPPDTGELTSG